MGGVKGFGSGSEPFEKARTGSDLYFPFPIFTDLKRIECGTYIRC